MNDCYAYAADLEMEERDELAYSGRWSGSLRDLASRSYERDTKSLKSLANNDLRAIRERLHAYYHSDFAKGNVALAKIAARVALYTRDDDESVVQALDPTYYSALSLDQKSATSFWTSTDIAREFVDVTRIAYEEGRGAQGLDNAVRRLLELVGGRDVATLDAIFSALSKRIEILAELGHRFDGFPREGSFWIACLTLTKPLRAELRLRSAFAFFLRSYVLTMLDESATQRLLRNID